MASSSAAGFRRATSAATRLRTEANRVSGTTRRSSRSPRLRLRSRIALIRSAGSANERLQFCNAVTRHMVSFKCSTPFADPLAHLHFRELRWRAVSGNPYCRMRRAHFHFEIRGSRNLRASCTRWIFPSPYRSCRCGCWKNHWSRPRGSCRLRSPNRAPHRGAVYGFVPSISGNSFSCCLSGSNISIWPA